MLLQTAAQSAAKMGKMMHAVAVAALLIFGIAGSTVGLFEDAGDVIMLDSGNFKEVVMETKAIVLVRQAFSVQGATGSGDLLTLPRHCSRPILSDIHR